ncbi:ATP-dependent zinc metalloprotease FtsH [Intestinibaculum porci]|uniref:ATP-dependent zinc metalloprotease FtsH n=1 Tax=Intestinibaculum porci TaxID=2487118 RepID=A0A3G9JBI3_9FIRM|nr:ATP-dependent zinc metalloprotease FtsH [Intestinibaculum porci]MDD6348831.1 ATP-dependent zinc metalloprotease FtsH [Intestinibaculum porci]MDD6422276.1 ATP-dependent zinc metalloprotease FtsH [Intestinibaculum porci]BBH27926.1 ATP-dependent zinc metalloprotease FtsH [Intestinibaculum porci]HAN57958.1 cell division protein FtsH [Erysipelotrichaceae bacterium]
MGKNKNLFKAILPWVIVLILLGSLVPILSNSGGSKTLSYSEFVSTVKNKPVSDVTLTPSNYVTEVKGTYTTTSDGESKKVDFTTTVPNTDSETKELMALFNTKKIKVTVKDSEQDNMIWSFVIGVIPYVILIGAMYFIFRNLNGAAGGNAKAFEFGNSRAKLEKNEKTRFSDVAGADEEKEEVQEIVDFLKNPKKFVDMGAKIPRGVLLVGPPGTGKTLLARAVAGEANVPFYFISGSEFVEMFVGVGAGRVRDMFKNAKANAPCIIFIDEIDAVGRQRGSGIGGGHDEREQTLNQLLVEMDGFEGNEGVIVLAATNRADVLDPALLRPGRFDRQIQVSNPDVRARAAILRVHARNKKFAPDVNFDNIAKRTPGFSGAQLANVLNEAALLAVRLNHVVITLDDVDEAIDRVIGGPAKHSRKYTEHERRLVAYHESGHAIIGLTLEDANQVQKVTIVPRGQAGGYNLMTPKQETYFETKNQLLATIAGFMGGRAAEEIFFGDISSGAANDIEQATRLARMMVTELGMSDLGPIKYDSGQNAVFLGRDYSQLSNTHSGQIAFEIDQQVRKIIDDAHKKATDIIIANKQKLETIAEALLEYETLNAEQIQSLYTTGKMPETFDGSVDPSATAEVPHSETSTSVSQSQTNSDDDLLDEMK